MDNVQTILAVGSIAIDTLETPSGNKKNVLGIRKETVFNLGTSEQIGAQVLLELLKKKYEK